MGSANRIIPFVMPPFVRSIGPNAPFMRCQNVNFFPSSIELLPIPFSRQVVLYSLLPELSTDFTGQQAFPVKK